MAKDELKSGYKLIGTRPNRPDGLDKVTGRARYGADIVAANMLHAAVVRSPYAHARIKKIDASRALALEGVILPEGALIGAPGEGFKIAMSVLDVFRSTVGAAALGFARRALDEALARARDDLEKLVTLRGAKTGGPLDLALKQT